MTFNKDTTDLSLFGYSGHAYVVCDILNLQGINVIGYFDREPKDFNPYNLKYLGNDKKLKSYNFSKKHYFFVAIGDNTIRRKLTNQIKKQTPLQSYNAIHPNSSISTTTTIGSGVMVGNGSIINAIAHLGDGVICNTQSIIEHDCKIGDFVHIAPGAILCGNVTIGSNSFIGAGAVVKEGITIGDNAIIGAGTIVIQDIPDNTTVVGNPQKTIR